MFAALPAGLIVLILILLMEFNSFRRVGIILVTVPLAATGVIPGLLISGEPFGFQSLLGVFALAGVVVNNAIVLIDRIEIQKSRGAPLVQAVQESVAVRTRPIFFTTATTVFGLLPLAFSQSSLWPPLAWAMISGLTASTCLTLLVVPALYKVLFKEGGRQLPMERRVFGILLMTCFRTGYRSWKSFTCGISCGWLPIFTTSRKALMRRSTSEKDLSPS